MAKSRDKNVTTSTKTPLFSKAWEQVFDQFNRSSSRLSQRLSQLSRYLDTAGFVPDCEFEERAHDYCFSLDVPGVDFRDINIELSGHYLRIYGERQRPKRMGSKLHRREKGYGSFSRSLTLPADADIDNVSATYEDGVLNVWIQKLPQQPPKVIPIEHQNNPEQKGKRPELKTQAKDQNAQGQQTKTA